MTGFLRQAAVDRSVRHVGRLRLRAADTSDRPRAQTLVEEVLRLTTLPGEDQGRVYFFRRLRLPPLDLRRPSSEWTARCSTHFVSASRKAVQASDAGAARADAVFFSDVHEPRRLLVTRLLGGDSAREWFWSQAVGVAAELPRDVRLEQVLDHWHVQAAGWSGVARELLPTLDVSTAQRLVESLRPSTASRWLAGLSGCAVSKDAASFTVSLPPARARTRDALHQMRLRLSDDDPRLLFFATLAVLESAPSTPQDARLVALATRLRDAPVVSVPAVRAPSRDSRGGLRPFSRLAASRQPTKGIAANRSGADSSPVPSSAPTASPTGASSAVARSRTSVESGFRLEHRTAFAGLFFLLHPLRHLGIVEAIEAHPDLALTHFVARVLLRLAAQAGIAEDDPILQPLITELGDVGEWPAPPADPLARPRALETLQRLRPSADLTERLWACAVRRWCRRFLRMSVADVLARPGLLHATPTSIDVTLPMSAVDLRLRRAGLDIDPGYLPWFDRVVHFHYHVEGAS